MKITDEDNMIKEKHIEYLKHAAQNDYGLKSNSFIYEVKCGFRSELSGAIYIKDNQIMTENFKYADKRTYETKYINKGALIEFRYEYDAHCRDIDNDYFRIDPCILALKCVPFAKIKKQTRWENRLNLKEILEQKLYDKII